MALQIKNVLLSRSDFVLSADIKIHGPGVIAVIGPSGGGKSTLLAVIAGFLMPDQGNILWNGKAITDDLPGKRPVATLFQDNNLFPHLNVLTNVALAISQSGKPSTGVRQRTSEVLARVGLQGFENRMPSELSGGQQSRVALARVLLTERPIVLMDEPFAALGPAQRKEMLLLVKEVLPHATILMVTHDPEDAKIAEKTILVVGGVVAAPQDTEALFRDPPEALRSYLA